MYSLHFPQSLRLQWLLHSHRPAQIFVGPIHFSPVFSFDAFVQRLTESISVVINLERPHLSSSMWLTYVFNVPTSSARSVNSSGLSLTVTSGRPYEPFGLRTLNFPTSRFRYPTSRARSLSIFMNSHKPSVRPCMRFEDLGLINTFTCLHHQEPVWLLPIVFFSPQIAHHQLLPPFLPRPTKCSLPKGNCCNADTSRTL